MDERREIKLEPGKFRAVHERPLLRPRTLWLGLGVFSTLTGLSVWGVTYSPSLISALFVIPPAVCVGVALTGLFPGFFFNRRN